MMMFLLFSPFAASLAITPSSMILAMPVDVGQWVDSDDYPPEAIRENLSATISYRLVVTPSGRAQSCQVTKKTRVNVLSVRTCATLLMRSRFQPALDEEGAPIYSIYKSKYVWIIPGSRYQTPKPTPDISVTVSELPSRFGEYAEVDVVILFDQSGRISKCTVDPNDMPSVLDDLACRQALTLPAQTPVLDENGKPTRWLEGFTISFSADRSPN